MQTEEMLEELLKKAKVDMSLRQKLFDTRNEKNPVSAFCKTCRELGYEIYDMDLISAGEEFYATMRRSTNGGGENSPMLEGEDDFYELFLQVWKVYKESFCSHAVLIKVRNTLEKIKRKKKWK